MIDYVEIFKTDISTEDDAGTIADILTRTLDEYRINFDLRDCDKILRVQAKKKIDQERIAETVNYHRFSCLHVKD